MDPNEDFLEARDRATAVLHDQEKEMTENSMVHVTGRPERQLFRSKFQP